MLNYVWIFLVISAVIIGAARAQFKVLTDGILNGAETAVTIAIGLVGIMAMWLGAMRIAEKAGIIQSVSRLLRPVLKWLFPDVPENHPAIGSMVMNIAANM
ncbi:MAG: nucleoside recognition domain-containing protein, partial [Verrucomicrobiia bacterium]